MAMGLPPITDGVMAEANSQSNTTRSELRQSNCPIERIFTRAIYARSLITTSPIAAARAQTDLCETSMSRIPMRSSPYKYRIAPNPTIVGIKALYLVPPGTVSFSLLLNIYSPNQFSQESLNSVKY
nr:hypothetical protein [uncultured bacterium]